MSNKPPILTGNPRTDRALCNLAKLLVEIARTSASKALPVDAGADTCQQAEVRDTEMAASCGRQHGTPPASATEPLVAPTLAIERHPLSSLDSESVSSLQYHPP